MANSVLNELGTFLGSRFGLLKKIAFTNNYNDLDNKPVIPTVSIWAQQPNKPNYTADEVGALPNSLESDLMKKSRIYLTKPTNPQEGDIFIQQ